jgi:hypothetical protein
MGRMSLPSETFNLSDGDHHDRPGTDRDVAGPQRHVLASRRQEAVAGHGSFRHCRGAQGQVTYASINEIIYRFI